VRDGVVGDFGREVRAAWDVLFAPVTTFRELREHRPLLAPWLVVSALSMLLTLGVVSVSQRALLHLTAGLDSPPTLGPLPWVSVTAAPAGVLVRWCVIAAVLWAPGALVSGAVTYRGVLSIVAYSSVPDVLGKGVDLAVAWFRGPELSAEMAPVFSSATSVGALFPAVGQGAWASAALEQLGLFSLWSVVLWVIGLRESFRWGWKRALVVAGPVWACFWLLATAAEVLGRSALGTFRPG